MGYDITKLTAQITTIKGIADLLSAQITANETPIEDAGVNGHYNLADQIEQSLESAQSAIEYARDTLKYQMGFNDGPTGPYPTGTYR